MRKKPKPPRKPKPPPDDKQATKPPRPPRWGVARAHAQWAFVPGTWTVRFG
jgi:hypothetical protein